MLGIPGISELWPILIIVLLLFGAKKLPGLARAMGSSIQQFKRGLSDDGQKPELEEGDPEAKERRKEQEHA